MIPSRAQAMALLKEYTQEDFLLRHAQTVESVMRWWARDLGEDEALWAVVGLLHDLDFERFPDEHCVRTQAILREHGVDELIVRACASHGYGLFVDIRPESVMEKVLYAVDELTGLIGAAALMRPSRSVCDMELASLRKKYKNLSFAAGCSRSVIQAGADMLGIELDTLLERTLKAMQSALEESER